MTAQRGYVEAIPTQNELGVHSLDHFALAVPDLGIAQSYFTKFGLDVRERAASLELKTHGNDHTWAVAIEGNRKRLHHISFGCYAEDLPRFKERLEKNKIGLVDPPVGFESNGVWFRDQDGMLIEIRVAPKTSLNSKIGGTWQSSPKGVRGAPVRAQSPLVQPRRMSHMLSFTSDIEKAIEFYATNLGLRLSDRTSMVGFMHAVHGSDHHILAFAQSNGAGIHHSSWDVACVDDIGLAAMHMAELGYEKGWGLGRHVLGSNFFHYVQDPWGSFTEYTCDIDYIGSDQQWEAGRHADEDSFYLWGPNPPDDFVTNYEAA